ncbi:MAG: hypothetical protein RLZZ241_2459 [Bacteroidota bacterium]
MLNFFFTRNSWILYKICILTLIPIVVIANFYGLNTHKFYWFKVDHYILPLGIGIHLYYLSVLNQKLFRAVKTDFQLQNLEIAMYGISLIYTFELVETFYVLLNYNTYNLEVLPENFLSEGILVFSVQLLFLVVSLLAIYFRKIKLGAFDNPENISQIGYCDKP